MPKSSTKKPRSMPKETTIFTEAPKCTLCQDRPAEKKQNGRYKDRCEHCLKYFNNAGEPFIIYKTTYVMRHPKGKEHWFCFFENHCCSAPIGYGKYKDLPLNEVLKSLEESGHILVDIHPPVMI